MSNVKVVASLMCADWLNMGRDIELLEKAGVDGFHLDIMDGNFVPNLSMNFWMVDAIRKKTDLPLAVHIMASEPIRFVKKLTDMKVDLITVHAESSVYLDNVVREIKGNGVKAGVALTLETAMATVRTKLEENFEDVDLLLFMTSRPGYMGQKFREDFIPKLEKTREMLKGSGFKPDIMADGGIGETAIPVLARAGVNVFVGGTNGLFMKGTSFKENLQKMKNLANANYPW